MSNWVINCNVFEDKNRNDKVLIVISDVVDEFERLIPTGPPLGIKPIELINDLISGPAFYWPRGGDYYKMALNISDVNYNQIAFQFSQELCRIYCDPRINNWFIQLLSHEMALYTLDFLGKKWSDNPPNQDLKDYWYNFDSYKSNLLGAAFSKVDMVKYQVANEWVKYQVGKLKRSNKIDRGKLLIIAYELLPMFKEYPESWLMLPYIGKCSEPSPPDNPTEKVSERKAEPNFEKLMEFLPENLKTFANKFYDKIGARELI